MRKMYRMQKNIQRVCLLIFLVFGGVSVSSAQIAIIVNKNNPINELSISELRAIFFGKSIYFSNNVPVLLCDFAPDRSAFCDKTFGFTEKRMSQHWFQLIFSGSAATPPKNFKYENNLLDFVAEHEKAIGYIDISRVKLNKVKVIKIEGKGPEEEGYVLSYFGGQAPAYPRLMVQKTSF